MCGIYRPNPIITTCLLPVKHSVGFRNFANQSCMKITYISHATLLIEIGNTKIITDPWVTGSSYCNQWHLFPKPVNANLIKDADYVLYSHGHEDHLHAQSLQTINKSAALFYPYSWYGGTTEFFNELGFKNVTEVLNEKTVHLPGNIQITYLSNNLDTIIVIQSNDTVLVNINDALPSASPLMIEHFIKKINHRWPKIDYVFSSYGGASYFPNTVHVAGKNDIEIAETRELFFITNFCKIVSGLNPKIGIPFATDFILLDDNQRWINNTKFPRHKINEFYQNYTKGTSNVQIAEAYSSDYFAGKQFYQVSPYHQTKTTLLNTIDTDYKTEIAEKHNIQYLSNAKLSELMQKIQAHILTKQYIIPGNVRQKIKFAITITDAQNQNTLNINFRTTTTTFTQTQQPDADTDLYIQLKSQTIQYTIDNEWGGDALIIGYGAEIFLNNADAVEHEYENYCIRLLSRYPNTKEYLKKQPLRALKYLLADDTKRKNLLNKMLGNQNKTIDYTDTILGKRNLWLSKSKCDICKACNL